MKKTNFWMRLGMLLALSAFAQGTLAAVCTSLSAGDWNVAGRWDCGHIPVATDTVVIAHNAIRMRGNYTVAGITINAGSVLNDDGRNLTVNGNVVINGQLGTNKGGALRMRTAGATLSGTGIVRDLTIEIDAANITLTAGSALDFDPNAEIDVGANLVGSLIIDGTVTAATQTAGDRVIRVSNGGTLTVSSIGFINAPNSELNVRDGGVAINNGTVTIRDIIGRTRIPAPQFTQGANSTLNVSGTICTAACAFDASAVGNTVNYTGTAQTVYSPVGATYANLTLSGSGAKTVPTGLTVSGNFTMSSTATTTAPAALTVGGDFIIGAGNTFTPGTGTVTLNGAAAQTISGTSPVNFNNLTVTNGASPNITLATNVTVAGTLTGTVTLTSTCPTDYTLTYAGPTELHSCPSPPTVTTNAATALTASGATLNGTVSSNGAITAVTFDYGLTAGYGSTATATPSPLAANAVNTAVSAAVTGLDCNTLYHFRAKGVNSAGTTNGGDLTFTTLACPTVVINTYYPGTASVLAGATSITLGAATGATTPIVIGDLLLIMQMQDATIDSTNTDTYGDGVAGDPGSGATAQGNSGLYEYAIAASAVPLGGGSLSLLPCGTVNAYTNADYVAGSSGQRRFQVIRVPVYASYTINAITALAWNGSTGGVLAFDVTGALNLNTATVDVSGMGFRGGATRTLAGPGTGAVTDYRTVATMAVNSSKGEGIAGTPQYVFTAPSTLTNTGVEGYPNGSHARGAPANAGGGGTDGSPADNQENTGGGGGANGGGGGKGGIGWCGTFNALAPPDYGCDNTGGFGGAAVTGLGATRLTLGGGGGGATSNNGTGTPAAGLASSGAAGGGSIMIRADSFTGSATFNANGSAANNTVGNDGSGGGGAGGTVMLLANSGMAGATINVNGGIGGINLIPPLSSGPHGPGGGGGGGYAITSAATAPCSATGGANGVTYNLTAPFGAYGSTPGSAGSCVTSLTAASIPGVALGAASCTAPLDHLEIQHASGTGLTCAASTLTIKACTDTAIPCVTPYTLGVSGTLSATGTPTVNWDGTTGGAAGAGFVIPNGSSSVTKDVQVATAGSVVFGTQAGTILPAPSGTSPTCNFGSPACTFTSADSGLLFNVPHHVSEALQNITVSAVKKADNSLVCTPAFGSVSKSVTFTCAYTNPASGTLPVRVGGQALNAGNNAGAACDGAGQAVSLAFNASGVASTTVQYADVGNMTLNAQYTGSGADAGLVMTGADTFIAAPASFAFSGITAGLIGAGNPFSATVTAQNALGATTPNFGREAEGVTLTSNLVAGNNPAIGNNAIPGSEFGAGGMVNDANGVATVNNLSWGEVGLITMTADLSSGSYLSSGLTAAGTSGNVGRFIPHHFDTAVVQGCAAGSFTYSGQPYTVTVTARNSGGGIIQNYNTACGYSTNVTLLNAGSATNLNIGWPPPGTPTQTMPSTLFTNPAACGGVMNPLAGPNGTQNDVTYTFPAPTVPATVTMRAVDADLVTSSSFTEGSTEIRSGRVKLSGAYGSELLQLFIPIALQSYASNGWVPNTADTCSAISAGNFAFSSPGNNLASCDTAMTVSGSVPNYTLRLAAPGSGNNGWTNLTLNLGSTPTGNTCTAVGGAGPAETPANLPWLQFPAGTNPTARATFGVYQGRREFIYMRENY